MSDNGIGPTGTLIQGGWFRLLDADGNVIREGKNPEVVMPVSFKEIGE